MFLAPVKQIFWGVFTTRGNFLLWKNFKFHWHQEYVFVNRYHIFDKYVMAIFFLQFLYSFFTTQKRNFQNGINIEQKIGLYFSKLLTPKLNGLKDSAVICSIRLEIDSVIFTIRVFRSSQRIDCILMFSIFSFHSICLIFIFLDYCQAIKPVFARFRFSHPSS